MKNALRVLLGLFTLSLVTIAKAQPGCPAVNAGNGATVTIPCGQTCTTLHAYAFSAAKTTAYSVYPITYAPPFAFNSGTPIIIGVDDKWSNVVNLPFNFCFFGQSYNSIIVNSNGYVSFNTGPAGTADGTTYTPQFIPSAARASQLNSIFCTLVDIDPTNQGQIFQQVLGTSPCRSFVVSWYNVPYYGDPNSVSDQGCSPKFCTMQLVLYENTNAIEMYIKDMEPCTAWQGGAATQGIQNATGTTAYTILNRNNANYTLHNDAYRFTPAGAPNYTISWYQGVTQIGIGDSIQVCPTTTTQYTANATYVNCDASTVTVSDNVFVGLGGLHATIDSLHNVSCNGGNDGYVSASYNTGSAVLSYGWNTPGGAGQTAISSLTAGTYVFSVTTAAGCTTFDTVVITQPDPLVVNVPDSNAYSCTPGTGIGGITAHVTGGTAGYNYSWNVTAPNDSTISGQPAGTYSVSVTDANNCSASGSGNINSVVRVPTFGAATVNNVTCNGANNGSIIVTLTSATPPINYTWSGGLPNNDTVTGLAANMYNVTATDNNGCTATATYQINEPTPIVFGSPTITDASCSVGGTITTSASGGTGAITLTWSNGDNGVFVDSLAAGNYTVTATDNNGCTATATYTVNPSGNAVAFGTPTITNILCNGAATGSITANGTGGTGTITYVWNTNDSVATITGLTAGTYAVTITDNTGCSASTTYIVNQPAALVIDSAHVNDYVCTQAGSITLFVSGGAGGTTYTWSGGLTPGNPQTNVNPGTYAVTITDQNACSVTNTYTVNTVGNVVILNAPNITHVSCTGGGADGAITANASGGTGTLLYVWSTNDSTQTITGLTGGNYTVSVTDQSGCSATATYTVNNATPIGVTLTYSDIICFGSATGTATANVTGGNAPFVYAWSEQGGNVNTIGNLAAGFIGVTVTDANGCSGTASTIIQQSNQIVYTSILNLHLCSNNPSGDLSIQPTGGIAPLIFDIPGVGTDTATMTGADTTGEFMTIPPGSYTFTITDSLGCTVGGSFVIPQAATNDQFTVAADSTTCFGSAITDGAITVTPASNQNAPYSYSINGVDFQQDSVFNNVAAGTYQVTVKNTYGCVTNLTAEVGQPAKATVTVNPDTIITAPGIGNQVTVTVDQYSTPVYLWNPTTGLSCSDCANPTVTADSNTTYTVVVSNGTNADCYSYNYLVVIVTGGVVMPNAFTPNGDGRNDFFGPVKSSVSNVTAFRVYDRWGVMVHNSIEPWDGKYKGAAQGAGTYVYYIAIETPDPENPGSNKTINQQGSVVLLR